MEKVTTRWLHCTTSLVLYQQKLSMVLPTVPTPLPIGRYSFDQVESSPKQFVDTKRTIYLGFRSEAKNFHSSYYIHQRQTSSQVGSTSRSFAYQSFHTYLGYIPTYLPTYLPTIHTYLPYISTYHTYIPAIHTYLPYIHLPYIPTYHTYTCHTYLPTICTYRVSIL